VPIEPPPGTPNIDEINERLNDGLKSCRSVVANYKALLSPDQETAEPSEDEAANDDGDDLDAVSGD
jgi:hypothetical protein